MKYLTRFVKRGADGEEDNAAIMILTKEGQKLFKQDMIYEMVEVLGELVVREVGKTHMDRKKWGQAIQTVMMNEKPLYTQEEFESVT